MIDALAVNVLVPGRCNRVALKDDGEEESQSVEDDEGRYYLDREAKPGCRENTVVEEEKRQLDKDLYHYVDELRHEEELWRHGRSAVCFDAFTIRYRTEILFLTVSSWVSVERPTSQ